MGLNRRTRRFLWALSGISALGLLPAACAPQPWIGPPPATDVKLPVWTPPPPPSPPATDAERAALRALIAELCPSDPGDAEVLSATAYTRRHWQRREGCQLGSRELLTQEIQLLREFLEKTARDDRHRPAMLHRLADTYFTLEEALYRDCMRVDAPESATSHEVEALKAKVIRRKQESVKAQSEGFHYCARLRAEHPDYQSINPCPNEPGAVPQQ